MLSKGLFFVVLVLMCFGSIMSQAIAEALAAASTRKASGTAAGFASGNVANADAVVIVSDNAAFSSASASASSGGFKPKPKPKPVYKPKPKYVRKPAPKKTCHDIDDDECPAIDKFDKCAFCILKDYPLKGFGTTYKLVSYYRGKELYNYVKPTKDCKGKLIYKGKDCPKKKVISCDDYRRCIKKCKDTKEVYSYGKIVL